MPQDGRLTYRVAWYDKYIAGSEHSERHLPALITAGRFLNKSITPGLFSWSQKREDAQGRAAVYR
jgi:hypothetical protein